MNLEHLHDWFDRHHVNIVRTQVTSLDGPSLGKYLNREKFFHSIEKGHYMSDLALAMDITGSPHLTFWHEFRESAFGDICIKPDLGTLQTDGRDPDLGHCIANYVMKDGSAINICPRTFLQNMVDALKKEGFTAKTSCEIEFMLFGESFSQARETDYKVLTPLGASENTNIYLLKNAYHVKPFMDKVIENLNWRGIGWEGWNDENERGQVELNLIPHDPVTMADNVVRVKQLLYETAVDMGLSLTFMPKMNNKLPTGMHIHHSLLSDGQPVFYDEKSSDGRSDLLKRWLGGLMSCLPATVSFLCPTINSYRRMVDFTAPPTRAAWGEENKSAAFRLITRSPSLARIESRLPAADANPYLAMGVIFASGLFGLKHNLQPPAEYHRLAWSASEGELEKLPNTITSAAEVLLKDTRLREIIGQEVIEYWVHSRRLEWINFQTESGAPYSREVTDWEYQRYFELV